jgi:hypothetical protein
MAKPFGLGSLGQAPNSENQNAVRFGSASLPFFAFRFLRSKNLENLFTPAWRPAMKFYAGEPGPHFPLLSKYQPHGTPNRFSGEA